MSYSVNKLLDKGCTGFRVYRLKFGLQGLGFWSRGTQTGGLNGPFITLSLLYEPYMSLICSCTSPGRVLDLMNPKKPV